MELMVEMFYISIPVMLIFLTAQLLLCIKGELIRVKLFPISIIILAVILAFFISLPSIFTDLIYIAILGCLITLFITPGLIGIVVAWVAYGIYKWWNHPK